MSDEKELTEEKIDPNDISVSSPFPDTEGVKDNVAEKIHQMLERGRRYFGSSGAAMTKQSYDPSYSEKGVKPEKAKEFLDGERDTTTILKKWIKNKPGAVLIDSVYVPDWEEDPEKADEETGIIDDGNTDHIVIIGSEVLLIDTRRWKKKKNYSVGDEGEALMTNKEFSGGEVTMNKSIHLWLEYLDEDAYVTGIVCINQEEVTVLRNRNWYTQSYRLVELDRFLELLDEKWKLIDEHDKKHINTTLVSQVVVKCIKPFDPYSKVFDMKSLQNFK